MITESRLPLEEKVDAMHKRNRLLEHSLSISHHTIQKLQENAKSLPLKGLNVYVEVYSNDRNISSTCFNYLEGLGAKVEKRINKKCNLVIWKDGRLKIIQKAKENNIVIVNSLWLEDCIQNNHFASLEKFRPQLPNDKDLPFFLSSQKNSKKRKAIEAWSPDMFESGYKDPCLLRNSRRKDNDIENSSSKIEINLESIKEKLRNFFENKNESLTFSKQKEGRNICSESFEKRKSEASSHSPKVRKGSSLKIKLENIFQGIENDKYEKNEQESEVKNMILSYTFPSKIKMENSINSQVQEEQKILREDNSEIKKLEKRLLQQEPRLEKVNFALSSQFTKDRSKEMDPKRSISNTLNKKEANKSCQSEILTSLTPEIKNREIKRIAHIGEKIKCASFPMQQCQTLQKGKFLMKKNEQRVENSEIFRYFPTKKIETYATFKVSKNDKTFKTFDFKNNKRHNGKGIVENSNNEKIQKQFSVLTASQNLQSCLVPLSRKQISTKTTEDSEMRIINKTLNSKQDNKISINDSFEGFLNQRSSSETRNKTDQKVNIFEMKLQKNEQRFLEPSLNDEISICKTMPISVSSNLNPLKNSTNIANQEREERMTSSKIGGLFIKTSILDFADSLEFCKRFNFSYLTEETLNWNNISWIIIQGPIIPKVYKIAISIVREKPIIRKEWIKESLAKGELQDYKNYLIKTPIVERKNLFSKIRFYIDKNFEQSTKSFIERKELISLIEEVGGLAIENVKACDFYVTKKICKKLILSNYAKIVTPQWIIDSVIEGKILIVQGTNYTML